MDSTELFRTSRDIKSRHAKERPLMWRQRISFYARSLRRAEPRFLLPVGAWNTSPLSHPRNRRWIPSRSEGKGKKGMMCRGGNKRGWKRKRTTGRRWKGGRKEARWLIDRVRVWEVGRDSQVQSQRTREPGLPARQRWTMAPSIAIRFPVRAPICMKTRNRNDASRYIRLVLNRGWPHFN